MRVGDGVELQLEGTTGGEFHKPVGMNITRRPLPGSNERIFIPTRLVPTRHTQKYVKWDADGLPTRNVRKCTHTNTQRSPTKYDEGSRRGYILTALRLLLDFVKFVQ